MKKTIVLLTSAICLLTSCKTTKYVYVPEVHTDTLFITKQQRDSIWLHDSVFVKEYTKGDTVFMLHDKWHTKYIESIKHDSIYIATHDTIPKPYPVEVKVKKPLSWWQKTRMRLGELLLGIVGVLCAIGIIKLKTKIWP